MPELTISEVGRRVGLRPSAIRYYERLGILPPTMRKSGQRRYGENVVYRLAVINQARQVGFSLKEVRDLFFGFGRRTTAGDRWKVMSRQKLDELDRAVERILAMKELLHRLENCGCGALDECGQKMVEKCCSDTSGVTAPVINNRKIPKL